MDFFTSESKKYKPWPLLFAAIYFNQALLTTNQALLATSL